jgi:signal peptidase I
VFALRVKGQSMIEDGIFDGDYLFVKKTPSASPGDIVVALIEDEATVKRYYPEGDRIRFQPANAAMEPIYVPQVRVPFDDDPRARGRRVSPRSRRADQANGSIPPIASVASFSDTAGFPHRACAAGRKTP